MRLSTFRDLSIRSQLVAIILGSTVLALGTAFVFVTLNDVRSFRRDMVDGAELVARVVGESSVSDLAFRDREESKKTLAVLARTPSIEAAWLYDEDGRLFSTWSRSGTMPVRPHPREGQAFDRAQRVLHVGLPIVYEGERYGSIHVDASTALLDRRVRNHVLVMLAALALLLGLAATVALRLQRLISDPILALADAARKVSVEHDYSLRVRRPGGDEVGQLYDDFNEMLAQIERRQAEREVADRRTREKSRFLANMSHELRTPLNSIIGFSEILLGRLEDRLSGREAKFLQNIHASGQHLLGIINDILDLSKVEAGKMEVHPEKVSVIAIVESVCAVMRGISTRRNVTLRQEMPPDLPVVEADQVKLKQILYNLASNAVKFSPHGSVVRIAARALDAASSPIGQDAVEILVQDHGAGIAPEEQGRVFEEFQQAAASSGTGRTVEGTGLGLTLVKRFVELHDGTIRLDSRPGAGTTFTVVLPRRFRGGPAPDDAGAPRILVVEDEPAAYKRVAQELSAAGFSPVWARSADEAVSLARGLQPAAVTIDVLLADMDGWEVLKQLKADPVARLAPVVMIAVLENHELGMALSADDWFVKPLDTEQLLRRLRSLSARTADPRVLVIGDGGSVPAPVETRLREEGFTLRHAATPEDGVAAVAAEPQALVLLDLMAEDLHGFDVALQLRADERTRSTAMVALGSRDLTAEDRHLLRGKGAARFRATGDAPLVPVVQSVVAQRAAAAR